MTDFAKPEKGKVTYYTRGPVSAVDQRIAVFKGSTGKQLQDGGMSVAGLRVRGTFRVDRGGIQQTGMAVTAFNKINLNNEVFDQDGWFDSAINFRFTPQVGGWYNFNASCFADSISATESPILSIYKNGTAHLKGNYLTLSAGALSSYVAQCGGLIFLNGSTDYVELFIYLPAGGTTVNGNSALTFLSGHLVLVP